MKPVLILLFLLFTGVSCHKQEPDAIGCDCQGPPSKVLTDALAIANKGQITVLDPDHLKQGWIILGANYCNPEFVNGKVMDLDTVYVSGKVRGPCNYGDFNYMSRLEITSIRKK